MKKQNAGEFYNNLAPKYDTATVNAWAAPEQVEKVTTTISTSETAILDIGIGTGQSIQRIYTSMLFKSIEGIDTSTEMLQLCKQKYPTIALHHGDFLVFNKFNRAFYDLIICCGTVEFITDLNMFFQKCKSILTHDGNIVLTYEPRIHGHKVQNLSISNVKSGRAENVDDFFTYRYEIQEFVTIAEGNGFEIVKHQLFVSYNSLDSDIIYSLVHMKAKVNNNSKSIT